LAADIDTRVAMKNRRERRRGVPDDPDALRDGLTAKQLETLRSMEHFRWTLRFVRRPMFQDPIPVLRDPQDTRYVVLEADGSINENPDFKIRD
jgi:hypothetical protein